MPEWNQGAPNTPYKNVLVINMLSSHATLVIINVDFVSVSLNVSFSICVRGVLL